MVKPKMKFKFPKILNTNVIKKSKRIRRVLEISHGTS